MIISQYGPYSLNHLISDRTLKDTGKNVGSRGFKMRSAGYFV